MKVNERIILSFPADMRVVEGIKDEENKDRVVITGRLITADEATRNGVSYTLRSLVETIKRFNKLGRTLPFLDTHDDSSIRERPPFGHIFELYSEGNDIFYKADIDPEEKTFLRKVRRGDITEVSLQAIVESVDEKESLDGKETYLVADVKELLEVSSVLIPGARNTTIQLLEKAGIAISEKTFVERLGKFKQSKFNTYEKFKENLKKEDSEIDGGSSDRPKTVEDDVEDFGKPIPNVDTEEEINTGNSGALVGIELPKKIKKAKNRITFIMDDGTTKEKAKIKCLCGNSMIKEMKGKKYTLNCISCKKVFRRK